MNSSEEDLKKLANEVRKILSDEEIVTVQWGAVYVQESRNYNFPDFDRLKNELDKKGFDVNVVMDSTCHRTRIELL